MKKSETAQRQSADAFSKIFETSFERHPFNLFFQRLFLVMPHIASYEIRI